MEQGISIIFAFRNRDITRIKSSMDSLQIQKIQNFEVIFVDYGSKKETSVKLQNLLSDYDFSKYFYLDVENLLWNKSKALNYGIVNSRFEYIFIADVDLIFHPETTSLFEKLKNPQSFYLFKLGYLGKEESKKLQNEYKFEVLKPSRFGLVNGMILASRKALIAVNGLDEFFHFYGAEDEDLFARLENAGYKKKLNSNQYFYHNWHKSFSGAEDKLLTGKPRIKNIMRINQRHFQQNRNKGIIKPERQRGMGEIVDLKSSKLLQKPSKISKIPNILAQVEHFLREELLSFKGEVIRAEFYEDHYYISLKHKIKRVLGKQTQSYISMKDVNDMVLKEILFNYRDYNYSFEIKEDLKSIIFQIQL